MRNALGVLAAVALVSVIVFTVVETVPLIAEIRGGGSGAAPSAADGDYKILAERLLSPSFPNPDGSLSAIALYPRALPPAAPVDIPLPAGSALIGSTTRTRGAALTLDVIVDVPGSVDEAAGYYERELPAKGFKAATQQNFPRSGGFIPSTGPANLKYYCRAEAGPWITVSVNAKAGAANDVRIHYEPENPNLGPGSGGPCSTQQRGPQSGIDRLPVLRPPDGVSLQGSGGGGGGNNQQSTATATTPRPPAELEAHFAQQLGAAGWTRIAGRADGALAWSTWKVPGQGDWQGLLLVYETAGKDRRGLTLRAEAPTGF